MAKAAAPSIEDLFQQIDEAVAALESGELPLEDALTKYEHGLRALKLARGQLDRFQAKLEELRAEDPPGGVAPA
jgi:exodeoxyribonuclease VII small subunit